MEEGWTSKQGQYLSFIYYYTKINGRPPAESDLQRYFKVTAPTVHQMILKLEDLGFLSRQPRVARSIHVLVDGRNLPFLE